MEGFIAPTITKGSFLFLEFKSSLDASLKGSCLNLSAKSKVGNTIKKCDKTSGICKINSFPGVFLLVNTIPRKAINRKINPALSIKKLLVNSSEKLIISGSSTGPSHSFEEKRMIEKSMDKNIVNIHAKDFKKSSLIWLVKESEIKIDAAGVAGSQ